MNNLLFINLLSIIVLHIIITYGFFINDKKKYL